MASFPSLLHPHHYLLLSPSTWPRRVPPHAPLFSPRRPLALPSSPHPPLRRGSVAARLGMGFSDLEAAEGWARLMLERAEGALYTLADAAVTASSSPDVAGSVMLEEGKKQGGDWFSGITDYMETVLKVLKDGLSALHVPYAYGFAIILLTVLVKAGTFPLSKKQVESAMAMRSLAPQVKAIQERYAGDKEKVQLETARLYKVAGVNPLAGCLPTLVTIPVWIGLYRALSNVANEGLLTEGFFWIPSLAGPTTIAARQSGSGISWLFPFVDGHPPLGWSDTLAYLVLPVLLIISQYVSVQIMQPTQGNDPSQKNAQAITKFLPLMIGYFALSVPSGLSLYWFTNNILSTAQQIWLQKLGGAKNPVKEYNDRINDSSPNIQMITAEIPSKQEKPTEEVSSSETPSLGEKPIQEISSSTTTRPGERFKQLKEQEERRKQEREEEKRRAEEAAKMNLLSNDEADLEVRGVESAVQVESPITAFTDDRSKYHTSQNESVKVPSAKINGNHLEMNTEEVKTQMKPLNGGLRHNGDSVEKNKPGSPEVPQEERTSRTSGSIGTQTRKLHLDQPDHLSEGEEV